MAHKTGLGRGLDALIPGASEAEAGRAGIIEIAVTEIRANPRQPRMVRGQEALQLEELAASIREHGVIQPLIVTRTQGPGAPYTLVAGERRWRAAQLAGLSHVPVILKDVTPQEMLEIALIENIQRNDLSPLEEAAAFQQLINEFGLTPDMVAERVGKSRVAIYNTLRLLKLPGQAQAALMQGDITEGHARALLGLSSAVDQLVALDEIKKHGLNVRQTEELIRRMNGPKATEKKTQRDREWQGAKEYESRLRDVLGTKVSLVRGRKGGRIVIEFYSDEEFGAIYEKLVGSVE
ncbi:MAG: ParB/RepB/Spo0J family partition protein [Anaerolineae bacterium]|jgi:ParB family chromosome partitioning protein|nr:ParB/RepB/Spo0J family partition protein [Anaerolineae bacterium]